MKKSAIQLSLYFLFGLLTTTGFAQEKKTITGQIVDDAGNPIVAASIKIKGSNNTVISDEKGRFTISGLPGEQVEITFIGYAKKELTIGTENNLRIVLSTNSSSLEGVVVTSLGIKRQERSLGYASTTINADELTKTAPTNFASAIYGKAPGVRIAAAPGGSTSGVAIQIRGINSITGRTQPLIVMDGIPIRDGNFNNNSYWDDQRLRSNGLVDLNPEDIESITVLKGASAAALYGSDATNGVILINTKSAKGKKKFTVDYSANYFQDNIAYMPEFQNVRGTGFNPAYKVYTTDDAGFSNYTLNGTNYRTMTAGSLNFGPKFDGKPILGWDGVVRPYSAQKNNWKNLFQTSNNFVQNLALSSISENSTSRFSITQQHYEGISLGSKNDKVILNLNSNFKFGNKFRLNLIVNDIWQKVHNRPFSIDRLINNFGGMMSPFDNADWYRNKYKTSLGYKYVKGSERSLTPDENIKYGNSRSDILDYMWNVNSNNVDENNNRLIASITSYYDINKNLQLRGRIATDWTSDKIENRENSSIPLAYGFSGAYALKNYNYTIFYGDILLSYTKNIGKDIELKLMGGYTADNEASNASSVSTNGGLTSINRFDLSSSALPNFNSDITRTYLTKDAFIGTANFQYKKWLFIEGTVRRDRTSTMHPDRNSFVYPSVNAALVISDIVEMPSWINYTKLRASWGIVGNYPAPYAATVAYTPFNLGNQGSGKSTLLTSIPTEKYGNDFIRPEQKRELEFGMQTSFLANRINLDLAYYRARIVDQILPLQLAQSTGSSSIYTNIGTLRNSGIEIAVTATPIKQNRLSWETGINFNFNNNIIEKLTTGSNELVHQDFDGNAAVLKSVVGRPIGDFYSHPISTDAKGNPMIDNNGDGTLAYKIDANKLIRYGNSQVKSVGGYFNTLRYKSFALEIYTDFRIGGYVMPTGLFWLTGRGITKESLKGMDKANGGISYYLDKKGYGVQTNNATGPNGEKVMDDGILLKGVLPDGTPNTHIQSQGIYYWYTYNWGGPQYGNSQYFQYIIQNSYWKVRELSLAYSFPASIAKKIKASNIQISIFGRNLFYLYRSIKGMDAEQLTAGINWNQSLNNAGTNFSTCSFGVSIRTSF